MFGGTAVKIGFENLLNSLCGDMYLLLFAILCLVSGIVLLRLEVEERDLIWDVWWTAMCFTNTLAKSILFNVAVFAGC